MKVGDPMYHYEEIHYASPVDEFDRSVGMGSTVVTLRTYAVHKVTSKGVFIDMRPEGFGACDESLRFVLLGARKRYAYPSREEAAVSFRARKKAEIKIYKARAQRAQRTLEALESL